MAWWGRQLYVRVTELGFPLEVLQPFLGSRVRSALWQQQAAAAASSNQQRACTQKVFLGHYGSNPKPWYGTKNLGKGAETRVRVFADIQNFALRAHCLHGIPSEPSW